jgi:hypothetical protein
LTIGLLDPYGNLGATSTATQTISLATTSGAGVFYASATGTTVITQVEISAGDTSAVAYYGDIRAGSPSVTATSALGSSSRNQVETITPAQASALLITNNPLSVAAGSRGVLSFELEDEFGNLGALSLQPQTIDLATTSSAGTFFANQTSVTPINSIDLPAGQAGVTIDYADTAAGTPTVTASATPLVSAPTQQELVNPAAAAKLVIATQPSSTATAGAAFTVQPVVYEEDQYGNVETSDRSTVVTASLATGAGSLAGSTTATVSAGVASFTSLADDQAETISLKLAANGLFVVTAPITVSAAPASKLVVSTQPPSSITAGQGFSLVVSAEDPFDNRVTGYNSQVTLSLPGDPSFTTTVTASDGVATFSGLLVPAPASGVAIQASAAGLAGTSTNPLDVIPPPPPPPPPASAPAPTVILEQAVFTRKFNKKGKPTGKPVFAGFTVEYSAAMNSATAGAASTYDVLAASVKKVKKKNVTTYKPVSFTVSYSPATNSVTLNLTSTKPFAKGGEITISGVTSQAGVALTTSDTTLTILPKAKGIALG